VKIDFKVGREQLVAADAVDWQLHGSLVLLIMVLNVLLKNVDALNRLRTVEALSGNHLAMLQLVLGQHCVWITRN
jgi:hypothetical protein